MQRGFLILKSVAYWCAMIRLIAVFVVVLSILEITAYLCQTGVASSSSSLMIKEEKVARLRSVAKLYQILEDGRLLNNAIFQQNTTREFALIGCLSDAMNHGSTPKTYKVIQEYILAKFDDDRNFEVYVSTNSLSTGDEYFYLYGVLSDKDLEAKLDFCEVVNGNVFEDRRMQFEGYWPRLLADAAVDSQRHRSSFNNGSKGGWVPQQKTYSTKLRPFACHH